MQEKDADDHMLLLYSGIMKHLLSLMADTIDHGPFQESEGPYFAARLMQAFYEQYFTVAAAGEVNMADFTFSLDLTALAMRLSELGAIPKCTVDEARGIVRELVGTVLLGFDEGTNRVTMNLGQPWPDIGEPLSSPANFRVAVKEVKFDEHQVEPVLYHRNQGETP